MMPEMDGLELVEHVRGHPALRDLPVVLLTQKTDERSVMAGYTRGPTCT
jgi:CheY-like chemotaxis protein